MPPPKIPAFPLFSQFSAQTWTENHSFQFLPSLQLGHRLAPLFAGSEGRNCWHSPESHQTVLRQSHQPTISCGSQAPACTRAEFVLKSDCGSRNIKGKPWASGCLTILFTIASLPLSGLFSMELHTHLRLWIWFICKIWGEFQSLWKQRSNGIEQKIQGRYICVGIYHPRLCQGPAVLICRALQYTFLVWPLLN